MRHLYLFCLLATILSGCTIRHPGLFAYSGYCTSEKHFGHSFFTINMNGSREEALAAIAKYFPEPGWTATAGLSLVADFDLTLNPNFVHPDLYKAQYNFELRNVDKDHIQLEVNGLLCSPKHKKRARKIERTLRKLLR